MLIHLTHLSHSDVISQGKHSGRSSCSSSSELTSSTLVTVSRHCGILWTKVEVVGLAWSSLASLTNSPTVITPGIAMPHRCFLCVNSSLLCWRNYLTTYSPPKDKLCSKKIRFKISRHPDGPAAAAALRRGAPSYVGKAASSSQCSTVNTLHATTSSARATRAFNSHLPDQRLFRTKI